MERRESLVNFTHLQRRSERAELAAIGAIFILAIVVRTINLNAGLWYDEIITLVQSIRLPASELAVTYGSLNNHVLYSWLAKGAVSIFGESPAVLRMPSVVFGVFSIIVLWRLFRNDGMKWAVVAAAALLAISYHHVWFSQNARGYTGLLLFTSAAALYLNRAFEKRSIHAWALYGIAAAVAMLIHLSAVFFIAAQAIVILADAMRIGLKDGVRASISRLQGPLLAGVVCAAIVLAVFFPMIGRIYETVQSASAGGAEQARQVSEWKNPLWTIVESVRSFGLVGYAFPLAGFFIAVGAASMFKRMPLVVSCYLLHIPLTIGVLSILSMRIWPRYFFVDIGFLFVALTVGAFWFAGAVSSALKSSLRLDITPAALKAAGTAAMIIVSLPLLIRNYELPKQDFDGAYDLIETMAEPGDIKITIGLSSVYFDRFRNLGWPSPQTAEELLKIERQGASLWVATAFPEHTRAYYPEIQAELDSRFSVVKRFRGTLSGGDVIVYRSVPQ